MPIPLRKSGLFVEPFSSDKSLEEDPPRALKSLAKIVDGDLCHRCGTCVGICPTEVLATDKQGFPEVANLSACTDCDLCVKVCPGDELDVPNISRKMFGHVPDEKDIHGHFVNAYLGYSTNTELRKNSTSGGLVTAILLSLLEHGEIDGAVVIAAHENELWKGKPIIARTKEEILDTAKSKYAITPTNEVFSEIRKIEGKYAIVGLPCQIHGFHKAAKLDQRIRERVKLTIGLFCHAAIEHQPLEHIWKSLGTPAENATKFISRVGKHPGTPHIVLKDGKMQPVYFPKAKNYRPSSMEIINILYRLYTPPRCLTCYDATAEFADIAIGDPWMPPPRDEINFYDGYSFALTRTKHADRLLRAIGRARAVNLTKLPPQVGRTSNVTMGEEKRWRAFRVIETRRRQGKPVPSYGFRTPRTSGLQLIKTELNIITHFFCFVEKGRLSILKLVLSSLGYYLLWLNNKRRLFRFWRRDTIAKLKRQRSKKELEQAH